MLLYRIKQLESKESEFPADINSSRKNIILMDSGTITPGCYRLTATPNHLHSISALTYTTRPELTLTHEEDSNGHKLHIGNSSLAVILNAWCPLPNITAQHTLSSNTSVG